MIDRIDKGRQSLVIAFLDPLKPAWVENVLNDFISDIPRHTTTPLPARLDQPFRAENFDPLIVSVVRSARTVDLAKLTALHANGDNRGIHIADFSDLGSISADPLAWISSASSLLIQRNKSKKWIA